MNWDLISDVILFSSIAVLGVFAVMGFCQLVSRKSFFKVDKELLAFFVPLILMTIIYFLFSKVFILNTRPDGSNEVSFPSSHVTTATTIFLCVALVLPRYLKSKAARIIFDFMMLALIVILCFGRVLSNQHWLSDVLAALAFSLIFAFVYYLIIRRKKNV